MEKLRVQLDLSKPKLTPYNLHMADQTIVKPLGIIKDLKIFVHEIPYVVTFIVIHSNVMNFSYFMLLGHPWLKDTKVSHGWGNNIIIIQRMGTIRTIHVTKKLRTPTKHTKVLVCYDFHSRIFDKEKDLMFATKTILFSIGPIFVPTLIKSKQPISLISLASLKLVEHVFVHVEPISILPILYDKLVH
jgi:hypothetical protein